MAVRGGVARRLGRWLERWAEAHVMEIESLDGTRFALGVDPTGLVTGAVALEQRDVATGAPTRRPTAARAA